MAIDRIRIVSDRTNFSSVDEAHWPENPLRYITFVAVLEHLYDPLLCIERALSWLKPGGLIFAEVPFSDYLIHGLLNFYNSLISTSYVANCSPMCSLYHLYEFRPQSFNSHGLRLGFKLVEHSYHPASSGFVPRFLYPFFCHLMKATHIVMQLTVWLRNPTG